MKISENCYVHLPAPPSARTTSSGTLPIPEANNVRFPIIDDQVYEGGSSGTPETFILRLAGTNNLGTFSYDVTMRIVDNDSLPPNAEIGNGAHAVARAEALVDNQPRLIPMLRNPGARATEFALRASGGGVDTTGRFQAETIWGATSLSRTSDGFGEHEHLLATFGAHFRMSKRVLLGGMLQFDRSESEPDGKDGEITGNGWMVGPYFSLRDGSQPLYFEGRLLYGRDSNKVENYAQVAGVDPANASFDGERLLVQGRVEGTFQLGNGMTLIPLADFSHVRDEMETFEAGVQFGDGGTVEVSKLQLGAEFEIPVETTKGDLKLKPGLRLVVSNAENVADVRNEQGELRTVDHGTSAEYRGRIDFGIDYRLEDNLVFGFESFYTGSGSGDQEKFTSYGAGLNLQFEF